MRISWGILMARDHFSYHVGLLAARIAYTEAALDLQLSNPDTLPLFARLVRVEPGTVHFPPIGWDGNRADKGIPRHHRSIENGNNYCTNNLQMGKPPATASHLIKGEHT